MIGPGAVIATVLATLVLASGCTSVENGTPSRSSGSDTAQSSHSSSHSSPASGAAFCRRSDVAATVSCLSASLSAFWSRELGRPVVDRAVANPAPADVPKDCRYAVRAGTAFSCPVDSTAYFTTPFIRRLQDYPPRSQASVRLAATMAHEMGHLVQFAADVPLATHERTDAQSRVVEQQADCLSGVWASSVGIPGAVFRRAAAAVFDVVDSAGERRTHGTPSQREAAIARGQAHPSLATCQLTAR